MEERGTSTTRRARAPPASGCTHLHVGLIVTGLGEDAGGGRVGELSLVAPAVILLQECHQVASWGGRAKPERGGSTSREAPCPRYIPACHAVQGRLSLPWGKDPAPVLTVLQPLEALAALGPRDEVGVADGLVDVILLPLGRGEPLGRGVLQRGQAVLDPPGGTWQEG